MSSIVCSLKENVTLIQKEFIEVPISGGDTDSIGIADILVVPEMYGPDLADAYGRGIKKVVFNQNCYLTFRGYSFDLNRRITPYEHKDVLATLINSKDGDEYLKYVFPDLPIHRFRLSIDPDLFSYYGQKKKNKFVFHVLRTQEMPCRWLIF